MELRFARCEECLPRVSPCISQGVCSLCSGVLSSQNLPILAVLLFFKPIACVLVQLVACPSAACFYCQMHAAPTDHWTQAYLPLIGPGSLATQAHIATHLIPYKLFQFNLIEMARIFDTLTSQTPVLGSSLLSLCCGAIATSTRHHAVSRHQGKKKWVTCAPCSIPTKQPCS